MAQKPGYPVQLSDEELEARPNGEALIRIRAARDILNHVLALEIEVTEGADIAAVMLRKAKDFE